MLHIPLDRVPFMDVLQVFPDIADYVLNGH
jgi:hypothetical protein